MLQDIFPHKYHCEYQKRINPRDSDLVIIFSGKNTYLDNGLYPTINKIRSFGISDNELIYLFSLDETAYFLLISVNDDITKKLTPINIDDFRRNPSLVYSTLVLSTSLHLYRWYSSHGFCSRCGAKAKHDNIERAMRCTKCNNIVYPTISPAIVVAITNGDKIVLTKYAAQETPRYALIAGFVEIGETLEDTVRREAMEEVGLKIKNIRYHGNQPWGFSGSLMLGFWAELDGDDTITMDENELREAVWVKREDVPPSPNAADLTHAMMELFRLSNEPKF